MKSNAAALLLRVAVLSSLLVGSARFDIQSVPFDYIAIAFYFLLVPISPPRIRHGRGALSVAGGRGRRQAMAAAEGEASSAEHRLPTT